MRISWDDLDRFQTFGVQQAVLYPKNSPGVPWNGLLSVSEKGDTDSNPTYIDSQRIRNTIVPGSFSGTISAYTYPDEFEPYNGNVKGFTGQNRPSFGFTWRDNRELHLVYNALAAPSSKQYQTIGADVNPVSFSWDFSTLPVNIPGGKPSAHIVIMLDYAHAGAIADLEDIIYGDSANDPSMPTPQAVYDIFDTYALLRIIDNGDGTWTAIGPDDVITMLDDDTFQIDYSSAIFISDAEYRIHSL